MKNNSREPVNITNFMPTILGRKPGQKPSKRPSFLTVMFCPEAGCGHIWEASNTGNPCPVCGCSSPIIASKWKNLQEIAAYSQVQNIIQAT